MDRPIGTTDIYSAVSREVGRHLWMQCADSETKLGAGLVGLEECLGGSKF